MKINVKFYFVLFALTLPVFKNFRFFLAVISKLSKILFTLFIIPLFRSGVQKYKKLFNYSNLFKKLSTFSFISLDKISLLFFLRSAKVGMYDSIAKHFKRILGIFFIEEKIQLNNIL